MQNFKQATKWLVQDDPNIRALMRGVDSWRLRIALLSVTQMRWLLPSTTQSCHVAVGRR